MWTTCFLHLGHILHDWAKCLRLDTRDNIQGAKLGTNVHFLARNALNICTSPLPPVLSSSCLLHQQVIPNNWWIGIEVLMRKRQTEAEMKHWLLIQIAVITISTLKLCNNLYSTCFIEVGREKRKINAYLQCFWINISLWFRIIIFWSHFKKAGDYTLITYCMVGNVSAGDK